jgi:hypothetical protein
MRMADKLSVRTDEVESDAGVFWFHRDLEHREFFRRIFNKASKSFIRTILART